MAISNQAPGKVRKGTATRRAGKATALKILNSARELLMREGYAQFSMRNVAEAAGLHLANLQYYFPKRDDLIRALLSHTGDLYEEMYERLLDGAAQDPVERLKIILQYQLEDIFIAETRQFFVQLWALLSTLEESPGALLGELYALDIGPLGKVIQALDPALPGAEVNLRARLLAGLIEGLMIVRGPIGSSDAEGKALSDMAYRLAFEIATGSAPSRD